MSLGYYVAARFRQPTAHVWIDGFPVKIPDRSGAINLTWAVGQPIAGGNITVKDAPFPIQKKQPVVVTWGFNGFEIYGFHGFVVDPQQSAYPLEYNVQVQDIMWIADFAIIKESVNLGNNKTAKEVIIVMLHDYAGIPMDRLDIPEIEQSPGVPWTLGTMTPILFTGVTPLQACLQICSPLGWWLFADEGGTVRMMQITGAPSNGPVAYYQEARDWYVSGPPKTASDVSKIVTRVIVTGAQTNIITGPSGEQRAIPVKDSWQLDNHPYLPDGKHREMTYSNPLIEYVNEEQAGAASCTGVAKRLLLEHSRDPFVLSAKVRTDPRVTIGMTVAGREPRIKGLENYKKFFVMSLSRNFGGAVFDTQVTLDGGIGQQGYSTIPNPTAIFTAVLHREYLDGVEFVEVFLDGTASKGFGTPETLDENGNPTPPAEGDPASTIQTWTWTDNSTPAQNRTGPKTMMMYPGDQLTAQITLTVTDVTGKLGVTTQTVNLVNSPTNPVTKRELSFAAGDAWYVTPDGGKNWRKETEGQKAYATPPISALGSALANRTAAQVVGLLAGGGSLGGALRATDDYLASPSEEINAGGANPISFIWQSEVKPERIWIAIGDQAFLSIDSGLLFYPKARPVEGADVTWITESADNVNTVDFLAGPNLFTSWDQGEHLTATLEGPEGSTAICYTSGFAKHWVGFKNVPEGSSPLRSAEGDTAVFPEASPPVTEVRGVTIMVDRPELYAVDQVGRIWKLDITGSDGVVVATLPEPV